MPKIYTDEELIDELKRFYRENGKIPTAHDMTNKNGYPSHYLYQKHFETHNKALEIANLPLNKKHYEVILDGTETCSYCGKRADEIDGFRQWLYINDIRYCEKHGQNPDYITGNLDINSSSGLGRVGEILVLKTLKIGNEHDCNRISCGYHIDMFHEDYGKIDVKTCLLSREYNKWIFPFRAKKKAHTYICIGLLSDRSIVEHVWIVPNIDKIRDLTGFSIINTFDSLYNRRLWEVDAKPYNDVWKTMKLKTCNSMTDKSEPKVKLTWEKAVKKAAEIRKGIELKSSM